MDTSFKIGDVVKIKSAGVGFPYMTISNIEQAGGVIYITCIWWNNASSKYDERQFIDATLIKA